MKWHWGGICCGAIVLGIAWRWPTLHLHEFMPATFGHLQYSDTVNFYEQRKLSVHRLPYVRQPFEYPVLTGTAIWLAAWVPGIEGYFLATSVLLLGCFLGCFFLLARLGPATRLARFAAAPGLALYGVVNWDALGLLGLMGGIYCAGRRRFGWAGIVLAFGASAKLFPAFILPVLLISAWYARDSPDAESERWSERLVARARPVTRLVAGFIVVTLAVNVPVALLNEDGWSYFFTFQSSRQINPDSIWFHLPRISDHTVSALFVALVLALVTVTCIQLGRKRGAGWEAGCLLCLLAFLLFSRDYSPQYDLWLLPLLAILACPLWLWLAFVALDVAYYAAIFWYYYLGLGGHLVFPAPKRDIMVGATVWGRETALALLTGWAFIRLSRARAGDRRARGVK